MNVVVVFNTFLNETGNCFLPEANLKAASFYKQTIILFATCMHTTKHVFRTLLFFRLNIFTYHVPGAFLGSSNFPEVC